MVPVPLMLAAPVTRRGEHAAAQIGGAGRLRIGVARPGNGQAGRGREIHGPRVVAWPLTVALA